MIVVFAQLIHQPLCGLLQIEAVAAARGFHLQYPAVQAGNICAYAPWHRDHLYLQSPPSYINDNQVKRWQKHSASVCIVASKEKSVQ